MAAVSAFLTDRSVRGSALGVGFLALWLTGIAVGLSLGWLPFDLGPYLALGMLAAAAFPLGDRLPLIGLIVVGAGSAVCATALDEPTLTIVPLLVAAFYATYSGLRWIIVAPIVAGFGALTLFPMVLDLLQDGERPGLVIPDLASYHPSTRILTAVVLLCALLLGTAAHRQRATLERLRERNAELETLRRADAARVVAEERTRIAREVHDVVAHHVSAMVIRAQAAARVSESRPGELQDAVEWIAQNGQEALRSMRQVVRVLRAEDGGGQPVAPGGLRQSLETTAERVRSAGFAVDVAAEDIPGLSPMHELAIARIAQESLTNMMVHAAAPATRLTLRSENGEVVLEVRNTRGQAAPAVARDPLSGNGIRSMRERAEALDGHLAAGPTPDGGWAVEARLPLEARVPVESRRPLETRMPVEARFPVEARAR